MPKGIYPRTEEHNRKNAEAKRGRLVSLRTRSKMSASRVGRHFKWSVEKRGSNHYLWKGDAASYGSKHDWVKRHFGQPDTCKRCGKSGLTGRYIQWANISGEYKREESDWVRLCASCHKNFDLGKITLNI